MFARAILMVAAATLILPRLGYSQLQANGQNDPQTPSEVVRFLVGHGRVVQVPVKGKVKPSIKKTEPSFAMPHGPSSIVLRRLPDYQAPYVMTIASFRRGLGRTTEIFAPSGLYFGEDFQQVGEFEEDRLAGKEESFVAELAFVRSSGRTVWPRTTGLPRRPRGRLTAVSIRRGPPRDTSASAVS